MIIKTFIHILPDGTKGKFTIREKEINGELFYFANAIDIESEFYLKKSPKERNKYLGVEITNGNQKTIYYRSAEQLENDIINKYGNEYLETEI